MSRILITGASGLLGANLVVALSETFTVLAAYKSNRMDSDLVDCFQLDLTERERVASLFAQRRPDRIIHCAAQTDVDYCEAHPEEAHLANVDAAHNVALAAGAVGAQLTYVSTDSVFDGGKGMYNEQHQPEPINVYGRTKLEGEQTVKALLPDSLVIRTNIYGWNMQEKESLAEWVLGRLERGEPVNGFRDVYFSPILVNDLADVLLRMLKLDLSGTYHVGGRRRCSKYQFARYLASVFGHEVDLIRPVSVSESHLAAPRPKDTSLDVEKVTQSLDLPMPEVVSGLRRFRRLRDTGYVTRLRGLKG